MRVSAGSAGPGYGCTCMSNLKPSQILAAMGRASLVTIEYVKAEPDGTLIFHTFTDPENVYITTFNPAKSGKLCKHAIACSAHIMGDWLATGFNQLQEEMRECLKTRKELYKLQKGATKKMTRSQTNPDPPSNT